MSVLDNPVEIGGLVFTQDSAFVSVVDLNYGTRIGSFLLEEGPGWVLCLSSRAGFLDVGQLRGMVEFADKHLKLPEESNES